MDPDRMRACEPRVVSRAVESCLLRFLIQSGVIVCLWVSVDGDAQSLNALHTFSEVSGPNLTNVDGANPIGGLTLGGDILYGTAKYGGSAGAGTVFAVSASGAGFRSVFDFLGGGNGANPYSGLLISGDTLYGTASEGGTGGEGLVFTLNTNGNGFADLHSFLPLAKNSFGIYTNSEGAHPYVGLLLVNGMLYGGANNGGTSGQGTLFSINSGSSAFATLHSFTSGSGGAYAASAMVLVGSFLYGTDYGNLGNGTVFAINTNGSGFTNYYAFSSSHLNNSGVLTNSDGANPHAGLVLSGNTLYGTTEFGGEYGNGAVFAINTDGSGFVNLHSFSAGAYAPSGRYINNDGTRPSAELILSGDILYGAASAGGRFGNGTLFVLNTDGTGFRNLYDFSSTPPYPAAQINSDGANPSGCLVLLGNALYGTTSYGGDSGNGTVFKLAPLVVGPPLAITTLGTSVVLSWSNSPGFILQSAPSLSDTFTNITGATNPYTNPIAGAQQFYRLSQ